MLLGFETRREIARLISEDPARAIETFTNGQATPLVWQKETLEASQKHPRLAIRSGHGVGKTATLSWLVILFLLDCYVNGEEGKVLCTAPTSHQLKIVLWAEVARWVRRLSEPFKSMISVVNDFIVIKGRERDLFATARTAKKDQPEALQGIHAERVLFVLDEASGIPDIVFEYGGGSLSTKGAQAIMTGNPTRVGGYFYDAFHKDRALWWTRKVSGADVPELVSNDYIESIKRKYGEESNVFRVRVLGEFPVHEDDVVIPLELLEAAKIRPWPQIEYMQPRWGLDVARFGDCRTALSKRAGSVLYEPTKWWRQRDTVEIGGLTQKEVDDCESHLRNPIIIVDAIGVGAGVADWLKHYGERIGNVHALNVSELPAKPGFAKMRDEIWWRTREFFESRDACLPEVGSDDLIAELCTIKYSITPNGKIKVQSKDDIRKEGRDSPDLADSFVMTNAPVPNRIKKRRPNRKRQRTWMGA